MKIVLVDDDLTVLSIMGKLFERRGHQVTTYESPLACPIYTSTQLPCTCADVCPDIIISDVDMPKVNGLVFIETVLRKGCKCRKMALISGKGVEARDLDRMTRLGATFFMKPVNFNDIDSWINAGTRAVPLAC